MNGAPASCKRYKDDNLCLLLGMTKEIRDQGSGIRRELNRTVGSNLKKQRKHIRLKGLHAISRPFNRAFCKTRVN